MKTPCSQGKYVYFFLELLTNWGHCHSCQETRYISRAGRASSKFFFFFSFYFQNIFIGLFNTCLVTILRTGSGRELLPPRAACFRSSKLHQSRACASFSNSVASRAIAYFSTKKIRVISLSRHRVLRQ